MKSTLLAILLGLAAAPASAAWLPGGTPVTPVPPQYHDYTIDGTCSDAANGLYIVYRDVMRPPTGDPGALSLRAVRITPSGDFAAGWTLSGIQVIPPWHEDFGLGYHTRAVLADGFGGADVVTRETGFAGEFIQRLQRFHLHPDATSHPIANAQGGLFITPPSSDADGAGGVFVAGAEVHYAPPPEQPAPSPLFAQRVDSTGALLWPMPGSAYTGGTTLAEPGTFGSSGLNLIADGDDGCYVSWIRSTSDSIALQHLLGDGTIAPGWPLWGIDVCDAPGHQNNPRLASGPGGSVYVAWEDSRGPKSQVYLALFESTGAPAAGWPVNGLAIGTGTSDELLGALEPDGLGGVLLAVRVQPSEVAAFDWRCHVLRVDSGGSFHAGWPSDGEMLNNGPSRDELVRLVPDGAGGVFAVFHNGYGNALYAQHVLADGSLPPGSPQGGMPLSSWGLDPVIARSGSNAIAVWNELDPVNSQTRILAQLLQGSGPVATTLSLVEATAGPGVVSLHWYAADPPPSATVERRTAESEWSALATLSPDGSGSFRYDDEDVAPGARYAYWLVWSEEGIARSGGETWVDVPGVPAIALAPPWPNPSARSVTVSFALPGAGEARLAVLDLSGRIVIAKALGRLESGRHVETLEVARLAAGIYIVRLEQGDRRAQARLAVVR